MKDNAFKGGCGHSDQEIKETAEAFMQFLGAGAIIVALVIIAGLIAAIAA